MMMVNQAAHATRKPNCRYDVFLSFRGKDTRYSFTGHLYDALRRKGFNIFMDDEELQFGDNISLRLLEAIEKSKISIVVLSENYAYSSWCLDELVEILDCMNTKNQLVWPVFYKVDPSDVRYQTNSYKEAMAKHEDRFGNDSEKVEKWRTALCEVAKLKGEHFKVVGYEHESIQRIVKLATTKLYREQLYVGEHVIGHQSRIEEVKSLLDIKSGDTVCMVGIHGTGGIGKTTLAKALYNLIVDQFECALFIEGVRERSRSDMDIVHLQETILSKLFEGENIKLLSVGEGATNIKDRLCHRSVLLVLDDVDREDQLEKLAGECNWFGLGSRIIITTRDKQVLNGRQVEKRYEMTGLNDHEALQLVCWSAFKTSQPTTNYEEVSERVVRYGNGNPLALKVIGSNLVDKRVEECESALKEYEKIPEGKIQDTLRISYDCLPKNAKYIFLDIACFFEGKKREYVEKILDSCDFYPTFNIGILVDKSLLTIDQYDCLRMHDLIQSMGKEVVRQEAPKKPSERSRLCFHADVLRVLTENSGSSNIEGIILDSPGEEVEVECSGIAFEKMNNLRILIVRNARFSSAPNYLPNSLRVLDWDGYPSESLPPGFNPRNVIDLSLPNSYLRLRNENPLQKFKHLTYINYSRCEYITHIPDASGVPNLRKLNLESCGNLIEVHPSVGFLKKLERLDLKFCRKLKTFPRRIWLPSLQLLNFNYTTLEFFPDIEGVMDKPLRIGLMDTRFKELPHSVGNLTGLEKIVLTDSSLKDLPSNFFMLPKIEELNLNGNHEVRESLRRLNSLVTATTGSSNLNKPHYSPLRRLYFADAGLTDEDLHFIFCCLPNLEELEVSENNFVSLPASIKESANLRFLNVSSCKNLEEIPELPSSIQAMYARECPSLTSEGSRMLWFQAFKEVFELTVIMPRAQAEIPDWFDHRSEGGIVCFWARRKFPVLALAVIFEEETPRTTCDICLYINGHDALHFGKNDGEHFIDVEGDHVQLCDLRCLLNAEQWPILDTFLVFEWNYVEVVFDYVDHASPWKPNISYWGAYVYRTETNTEDIQFMCPFLDILTVLLSILLNDNSFSNPPSILHNPPRST